MFKFRHGLFSLLRLFYRYFTEKLDHLASILFLHHQACRQKNALLTQGQSVLRMSAQGRNSLQKKRQSTQLIKQYCTVDSICVGHAGARL